MGMPVATPQAIGRTLARFGRVSVVASEADDAAPSSREAIFDLVERSAEPLTIEQICRLSGLHANTVRSHLEVLHAAGRVERAQEAPRGRGRPPWLYNVAPGARSARAELAETLLDQLEDAAAHGLAEAAAERWAATVRSEAKPSAHPATPDDAVAGAADALEDLGFDARVNGVGDRIELRNCPYAALVADRPVICDIHAALLSDLLGDSGQPVSLRRLDVWVRPGVCVAHLNRPDLTPARTIAPQVAVPRPGTPGTSAGATAPPTSTDPEPPVQTAHPAAAASARLAPAARVSAAPLSPTPSQPAPTPRSPRT